ncbi:hypothetical protein SDC9_182662 [bioreactor metagenome]|uniref:Uncharacterized protein n=1 Tax=bioreactor metagenome TaxID=1076179 RepID=A0A645H810_9ZZZZ
MAKKRGMRRTRTHWRRMAGGENGWRFAGASVSGRNIAHSANAAAASAVSSRKMARQFCAAARCPPMMGASAGDRLNTMIRYDMARRDCNSS